MVAARLLQHVGHEFGSNRSPALVFLVLASIREKRDHGGNPLRAGDLAGVDACRAGAGGGAASEAKTSNCDVGGLNLECWLDEALGAAGLATCFPLRDDATGTWIVPDALDVLPYFVAGFEVGKEGEGSAADFEFTPIVDDFEGFFGE